MQRRFFFHVLDVDIYCSQQELLDCLHVQTHASQMERSVSILESSIVFVYLLLLFEQLVNNLIVFALEAQIL